MLVALLCATTATAAQASGGHGRPGLGHLMAATAKYQSLATAEAAGYALVHIVATTEVTPDHTRLAGSAEVGRRIRPALWFLPRMRRSGGPG